jgi:diguanylate cyclase (GGDEF)-like protein
MAVDTLASALRSMGEFALDQDGTDAATFRQQAEAWAQHVLVAAPAPGAAAAPAEAGRRDWQAVRRFVREYCRASSHHAVGVASGLREVIWVFIRSFAGTLAADQESDERIRQQVAHLEALAASGAPGELKREVQEVVGGLARAFDERSRRQREQMATLGSTVRQLGDELETTRRESELDPLTRLHNRKALDAYLERSVEMARAFGSEACLLVIDVDHFKSINDAHGHAAGDQVLVEIANAVAKVFLRKSDFVARYGGDEFVVVLRETSLRDVPALAERVLERVRAVRVPAGAEAVTPGVSMGAAALQPGDDGRTWFERADRGLYAAKAAGRDRLAIGEPVAPADPRAATDPQP